MSDPPDFSLFSPVFGLLDLTGFCPIVYIIGQSQRLERKQAKKAERVKRQTHPKRAQRR